MPPLGMVGRLSEHGTEVGATARGGGGGKGYEDIMKLGEL